MRRHQTSLFFSPFCKAFYVILFALFIYYMCDINTSLAWGGPVTDSRGAAFSGEYYPNPGPSHLESTGLKVDPLNLGKFKRFAYWGSPYSRLLGKWIKKVNLSELGVEDQDPLSIRNMVAQKVRYISDKRNFGDFDYWISEPSEILTRGKDDCEGHAVVLASIMYTLGFKVRIAVGHVYKHPTEIRQTHVLVLLYDDNSLDPHVMDSSDNQLLDELPRLSSLKYFHLLVSGSADGETWIHGDYQNIFNKYASVNTHLEMPK